MFGDVKGQEQGRRVETFLDQHGREYRSEVEIKTGYPTVLEPLFKAPLSPDWMRKMLTPPVDDRNIVKVVNPKDRARMKCQIWIDYDAWLADNDKHFDRRQEKLFVGAKAMAKGKDAQQFVDNPPPVLLSEIGSRPWPLRSFIVAMKAGNAWALGLTDKVPAKVEALLAELEIEFGAKRRRRPQLGNAVADPFADDEEPNTLITDAGVDALLDPFGELEEQVDPDATGGQRVPVKPKKQRTKKVEPLTPAA